jgi:hypothetical protein
MKKFLGALLVCSMLATFAVACSDGMNSAACAATLTPANVMVVAKGGGSSGGRSGGSGSRSTSTSKPSSSSRSTPSAAPRTSNTAIKPVNSTPRPSVSRSGGKTTITPPSEKAYSPPSYKTAPSAADRSTATKAAPKSVTTTGSYTSPVTHHVYVYHDPTYFSTAAYLTAIDLYNPYDPFNWYYRPFSPFYGRPYMIGTQCDGGANEFKPSQQDYNDVQSRTGNVEVNVNEGKTDSNTLESLDSK